MCNHAMFGVLVILATLPAGAAADPGTQMEAAAPTDPAAQTVAPADAATDPALQTDTLAGVADDLAVQLEPLAGAEGEPAAKADPPAGTATSSFILHPSSFQDRRLLLLGLRAGPSTPQPFNRLATSFLLDFEGVWAPHRDGLAVSFDVGYTRPAASGTRVDPRIAAEGGRVSYSMTVHDLAFGLGALYRVSVGSGFVPFAGLGARLHLTRATVEQRAGDVDLGTWSEQNTRVGARARVGLAKALGPGELGVELQADFATIDHLVTGDANTGFLGYQLSYLFAL